MATKSKILVVDDERSIRESIKKILERKGFDVDLSENADDAMGLINETPYNLVLLDIMMPRINGMDLLKTIKTEHNECNVVMITGYPSLETAVKSTQEGAKGYIPKPFTPEELLKTVEKVIGEDNRDGFCEKGRQFCNKYQKMNRECESDCPLLKAQQKGIKIVGQGKEKDTIDADLPFEFDEVEHATSGMFARIFGRSDFPILGHRKYYEENKNILVVDDEVVICNSVRKILEAGGYKVDYANTTSEALNKLDTKKYALAIVDLRLPEIGGEELLKQMAENHSSVKTIIITGYASIGSAVETTKLGAKSYIPKPFTPEELKTAVISVMQEAA